MKADAKKLRDLLISAVSKTSGAPLAYSGGVDSSTVLAAQLALGARPTLYSFAMLGVESPDRISAGMVARAFGLELRLVEISADPEVMLERASTVMEVVRANGFPISRAKVYVECGAPWIDLMRAIMNDGEVNLNHGMAADELWGNGRKYSVALRSGGEDEARELRRKAALDPAISDRLMERIAELHSISLHDPFTDIEVRDYLLSLDMRRMNRLRVKSLALECFPEFWETVPYRQPGSFQVVSGIREAYGDRFLTDPELNSQGSMAVAAVYRRLGV
jgi:asparagine synthetase B (glutamine-hydrolysing)